MEALFVTRVRSPAGISQPLFPAPMVKPPQSLFPAPMAKPPHPRQQTAGHPTSAFPGDWGGGMGRKERGVSLPSKKIHLMLIILKDFGATNPHFPPNSQILTILWARPLRTDQGEVDLFGILLHPPTGPHGRPDSRPGHPNRLSPPEAASLRVV